LIALHPNGQIQRYYPDSDDTPPPLAEKITVPQQQGDARYQDNFPLTDGTGLQAVVLVVSDRSLPAFRSWRDGMDKRLPWEASGADVEGVWRFDPPDSFKRLDAKTRSAPRRSLTGAPRAFVKACEALNGCPDVTAIQAWAFPVRPVKATDRLAPDRMPN
jgi:hypothetical protein